MRKLAFAFTQLHLLNLINLKTSIYQEDEMDLIAYTPNASGALDIINRIKEKKIFSRVLIVENYYPKAKGINRFYYRTKELVVAVKNKQKITRFVKNFEYDEFLSYGSNMEAYIALSEINKKGKVSFIVYEEGIGTYVNKIAYALKPWHTITLKLIGISIPVLPDELLVYVPELLVTAIPESIKINRIPKIKCKELINELWNYNPSNQFRKYSTICFEQPVNNNNLQADLFKFFDKSSSVVKMHPRSRFQDLYKDMNIIEKSGVIWEVECMNESFANKRLVSLFSTACMTPKMMFGDEPDLIFLERLQPGEFNDKMFMELIKRFKSIYIDSSKVKVPLSIDELKNYVMK